MDENLSIHTRLIRFVIGLLAIVITLVAAFAIRMPMAHRWGATNKDGGKALLVGILAALALPVFLIVQPPIALRVLIDCILLAGLAWSVWPVRKHEEGAETGETLAVN